MTVAADRTLKAVAHIAKHAATVRFEALDATTVLRARQTVLDTLGTTLGGYQTPLGRRSADFAASFHAGDDATLVGDGRRSTVEGAAFANAVMSKHLGMDDSHRTAGHVAAELIPLALALGEARGLGGRSIVTALAVGYDVFDAIQPNVKTYQRQKGLDHKGQAGTLASSVTAGMLMGLDREGLANSLALSMDMACGTEQYVYDAGHCDTKDLLAGYGARNGLYAATLAAHGFQGPPGALDGPYGYYHAFGDGYDPSFLDNIGKRFALADNGFKPHAGCRHVHGAVDVTQSILAGTPIAPDAIASIEIGSYRGAVTPDFRIDPNPPTMGLAGFSLPAAVAVTIVRGGWYREDIERYADPEVQALMQRTSCYLDEEIEAAYPAKNGTVVRITTNDGTVHEGRVEYAKGEPENMLSDAEFETKFRRLVGSLLPEARIEAILTTCARFEELDDVGDLVRLTAKR
jgi:2-methylcitrate dehydratase PrpD